MIYKLYEKHPTLLDPLHVLGWWSLSLSRKAAILTFVLAVWIFPEVSHKSKKTHFRLFVFIYMNCGL